MILDIVKNAILLVKKLFMLSWKYRIKPFIIRTLRSPIWFIQRGRRGWSDQDAWNGDMYLASQIAGIMQWHIDKGIGVSSAYGTWEESTDILVERRNKDYARHIAVFKEYRKNGPAFNQEWKDDFGGVLDDELRESLQWLAEHFTELWD
jgi:hypothetical protein